LVGEEGCEGGFARDGMEGATEAEFAEAAR